MTACFLYPLVYAYTVNWCNPSGGMFPLRKWTHLNVHYETRVIMNECFFHTPLHPYSGRKLPLNRLLTAQLYTTSKTSDKMLTYYASLFHFLHREL